MACVQLSTWVAAHMSRASRITARNVFQGRDDGVVEHALGMLSHFPFYAFLTPIYTRIPLSVTTVTLPIASLKQDEEGKRIPVMVTRLRRGRHWETLDKAIGAERLAIEQQRLCRRAGILAGQDGVGSVEEGNGRKLCDRNQVRSCLFAYAQAYPLHPSARCRAPLIEENGQRLGARGRLAGYHYLAIWTTGFSALAFSSAFPRQDNHGT